MANETVTPPTQADPKTTSNNIAQGIHNKTNGKAPAVPSVAKQDQPAIPTADPNAGKEKYVVDSKEVWLTPEQARAYVQKGIAFEPKVTQLGHLQHEMQLFLNDLKNNPAKILFDKRLGHNPDTVFENIMSSGEISEATKEKVGKWYWDNVVHPMQMSPEERRAMELEKENKSFKDREAAARDQMIKAENQRRVDDALTQIKTQIGEALKESGLQNVDSPLGTMMARRVADVMRLGYVQRQVITPKAAIEKVKAELKELQTSWYDNLDEEALVKELGEKNAEKVKKYFLKIAKDASKEVPAQKNTFQPKKGERKTESLDDFHDYLDELKKKG